MNIEHLIILILLIVIFYLIFYHKKREESFIDIGSKGEFLNPFDEPDKYGFVSPETTPAPKPKCCPTNKKSVEPEVIKVCKKPEPKPTCEKQEPEPSCKKEYTCPPCPTSDCPPCPKLECPPCKPCQPVCPSPSPDLSKYVLKSSIPPCPTLPDMSNYILKSEIPSCHPLPDMSKYVLKSSVPPQTQCPPCPPCPPCNCPNLPEINVCENLLKEKGKDCGVCPPCPRVKCPNTNKGGQNGKYYTDEEINNLVNNKNKISNTFNVCKNQRIGNNNSCTPQPYESGDFHSPLTSDNLTGAKL